MQIKFSHFRIIALSHIHVSAAYRSHIDENYDTPRCEAYFVPATYVPRTCDVPVTFLWRISDVSVFHFRMYGVSRRMCFVRVTYVWHMNRTRDVSTTYALRSILIYCVSVAYPWFFNTDASKMVMFTSS